MDLDSTRLHRFECGGQQLLDLACLAGDAATRAPDPNEGHRCALVARELAQAFLDRRRTWVYVLGQPNPDPRGVPQAAFCPQDPRVSLPARTCEDPRCWCRTVNRGTGRVAFLTTTRGAVPVPPLLRGLV